MSYTKVNAAVAQLDRVPGYEPDGRGFESLRLHQISHHISDGFFICKGIRTERPKIVQWTVFGDRNLNGQHWCVDILSKI